MTASLQATAALAADLVFQGRVQVAMYTSALNVATESGGTSSVADYQARHTLAVGILQGIRPNGAGTDPTGVAWLTPFVWSTVTNTNVSGKIGLPVPIVSSTAVNPSVITTGTHGLTTGMWVVITGHAVNTAVNGVWPVTVINSTSFTVPVLGSGAGGATGTVTETPADVDIQTSVYDAFSPIAGSAAPVP